MSRFPKGSHIAVTGANGYIGSHIVKQLLEKEYHVRAVIRDPSNPAKVAHLKAFPRAELLDFAKGELKEEDYAAAFVGVKAVIHTATPYIYTAPDPDRDIVQPAIEGTLAALRAALKCKVERVVITSSGGAFLHFPVPDGYKFTVNDWNTMSTLTNNPYFLSKRKAEEAAWAFAQQHKEIEVVVVNPLYVLGPTVSGEHLNQSLGNIKKLLMGEPNYITPGLVGHLGLVDVRDVATAHLIAVENPAAINKRLFTTSGVRAWAELAAALKRLFPQYPNTAHPPVLPAPFSIDIQPLAELGLSKYIDVDTMLRECVESLIAQKVIPQM